MLTLNWMLTILSFVVLTNEAVGKSPESPEFLEPLLNVTAVVGHISVPPVIVESMTSNDTVVREGTNVTLTCKAKGLPEPYVMWRREDEHEMSISGENGKHFLLMLPFAGLFSHFCEVSTNYRQHKLSLAINFIAGDKFKTEKFLKINGYFLNIIADSRDNFLNRFI
jgi:Immunoglobulin domain